MNNTIIRKMNKHDVDEIMEIEKVSFGTYHWSRQSFITELNNTIGKYFTALDKNTQKVIGYCGFWLIMDEAHVTTIAVKPTCRGRSIGELLLQEMIMCGYELRAKWFTLEVRASNISAQGLYNKYEFKSLGLRRNYYQDNNEDALIMWTENIWDEKFKKMFDENVKKLANIDISVKNL